LDDLYFAVSSVTCSGHLAILAFDSLALEFHDAACNWMQGDIPMADIQDSSFGRHSIWGHALAIWIFLERNLQWSDYHMDLWKRIWQMKYRPNRLVQLIAGPSGVSMNINPTIHRSGTGDAGSRASRVPSLPMRAIHPLCQPAIPDEGRSETI